jgi:L-fucose mutarotase
VDAFDIDDAGLVADEAFGRQQHRFADKGGIEAILGAVRIDEVNTMGVDRTDSYAAATPGDPAVWGEYRRILAAAQSPCELQPIVKWDFYAAVASDDHVLTIQTADTQPWANLLLSLGCRTFV